MIQEAAINSTAYSITGLSAVSSFFPFLIFVVLAAILIGLAISITFSKKMMALLSKVGITLNYTLRGGIISAAGYSLWRLLSFAGDAAGSIPLEYYAYGLMGFVGLTLLGYVSTKIYQKIMSNIKKAKAVKK